MKQKPALIWDTWNRKHIKKHNVSIVEAEEAYKNEIGRSESYEKRQSVFGITKKDRPITVVVSYAKQEGPYVVSVRPMSKKERSKYLYENQKN